MTGGPANGRLSGRQVALWVVVLLIVVVLVILFFVNGRRVRPMVGTLPVGATWPVTSS